MKNIFRISEVLIFVLSILLIPSCKKEEIPILTTSEATNVTANSATTGGTITDEGSGTVISRGVCWSTDITPTITDNKTVDGAGAGSFSSNITGLNGDTKYYVRAYATNSAGTGYGLDLTFHTLIDQAKVEEEMIQDYIFNNPNHAFQLKSSGLYYLDLKTGTGPAPVTHDTAYVKYTGKFFDGTVLDTNVGTNDTLIFPVGEGCLISGLDEGITYMKEGGKAMFLTPSKLAYGSSGFYIIPGYTPLLWEVDLVKVRKR